MHEEQLAKEISWSIALEGEVSQEFYDETLRTYGCKNCPYSFEAVVQCSRRVLEAWKGFYSVGNLLYAATGTADNPFAGTHTLEQGQLYTALMAMYLGDEPSFYCYRDERPGPTTLFPLDEWQEGIKKLGKLQRQLERRYGALLARLRRDLATAGASAPNVDEVV